MKFVNAIFIKYLVLSAWLIIIFIFSSQGHEVSSGQSGEAIKSIHAVTGITFSEFVVRKGAHFFLYFVLGALAFNVFKDHISGRSAKIIAISVFVAFVYACTDEFHQSFVPGRAPLVSDVILDTFASFVGACVFSALIKLLKKLYCKNSKNNV